MDKSIARAVGAALAVYTYVNSPLGWGWADVFMCADKYAVYIMNGQWPKEAKLGKEEVSTEA